MHLENLTVVYLTTISFMAVCFASPTRTRYCGSNLADALKLACGSRGYNVPSWSSAELTGGAHKKHALIRSLGVVDECCYFGCSWRTLASYCAEPRTKKSKKSSGDEDLLYDSYEKIEVPSITSDVGVIKESELAAIAPEVGDSHHKPGRMGKKGRYGHKRRKSQKGRKGRKREQRRRGSRVPRCRCETRKKRPKKVELENIRRSAPVFGTVSPEYLRLPRTLDEVPPLYHGMQGY